MKVTHGLLGILLLGALIPGVGRADQTALGSATGSSSAAGDDQSGRHGGISGQSDKNRSRASDAAGQDEGYHVSLYPPHKGRVPSVTEHHTAPKPLLKQYSRAAATRPGAAVKTLATAKPTPHFTPNKDRPTSGQPVSGNAVARHTAVIAALGGPTAADPKKHELVILGGTMMARTRRF